MVTRAHGHPCPMVTVEGIEMHGSLSCPRYCAGHFPDIVASSTWNGEECQLRDLGYINALSI